MTEVRTEMNDHLTLQDLEALRFGALSGHRAREIANHLSSCAQCASLSWEAFTVAGARSFEEALRLQSIHAGEEQGGEASSAGPLLASARRRRNRNRYLLLAAASIAIAVVGSIRFLARTADESGRSSIHARAVTPVSREVPVPAALSYGRAEWDAAVAAALQTGSLARPERFRVLRPEGDILRSRAADSAAVLEPAGTSIESRRPELSWPATLGAEYIVTIARGDVPVLSSPRLPRNHWVVTTDLPRGGVFRWEVEVLHPEASPRILPAPPQPPALFYVLDENSVSEIGDARRRFPEDHLLLGVLYARHGVYERAVEELRLYAAEHPSSGAARRLLESVRNW